MSSLRFVDICQLFGSCTKYLWYFTNLLDAIVQRDSRDHLPDPLALMPNLRRIALDIRQVMLFDKRIWTHLQTTDPCWLSP